MALGQSALYMSLETKIMGVGVIEFYKLNTALVEGANDGYCRATIHYSIINGIVTKGYLGAI